MPGPLKRTMNAEFARELTERSKGLDNQFDEARRALEERIRTAAEQGEDTVNHPFRGLTSGMMLGAQQQALEKRLREHFKSYGFKIVDHPDPDPGHPCGGAYTSLSWK